MNPFTHSNAYCEYINVSFSADISRELKRIKTSKDRSNYEWRMEVSDQLAEVGLLLVGIRDMYTNNLFYLRCIRNTKVKHTIV